MFEYTKFAFMCTTCSRLMDSMHEVMQHQREEHGGHAQPEKFEVKVYMCSVCETHYGSVANCRRHELDKHSKKFVAKLSSFLNIDNQSADIKPIVIDDMPQESDLATPSPTATAPTTSTTADSSPPPNTDQQSPRGDSAGGAFHDFERFTNEVEDGSKAEYGDDSEWSTTSTDSSSNSNGAFAVNLTTFVESDQDSCISPVEKKRRFVANEYKIDDDLNRSLASCDKDMFDGMLVTFTSSTNRNTTIGQFDESQKFVKRDVKLMIGTLGGEVVDNIDVADPATKQALLEGRAYCISNTYYRTAKYLTCLAAGAILLSHKWVLDSVARRKLLPKDDYMLPAGAEFDSGNEVKQIFHEMSVERESPFGSVRVVMESQSVKSDQLYETWKPILAATGGSHILETPEEKGTCTAQVYAVVDDDTKSDFVERCRARDIPLLTSNWLIACLIHNELIDPKSSPRFTFTQNKK